MQNNTSIFKKPQLKTEPPKKSILKKIGCFLWKGVKRLCMALGVVVLVSYIGIAIFLFTMKTNTVVPLPDEMVLYYRLDGGLAESGSKPSLMDPFPAKVLTMPQLVRTLDRVERDDRVKGMVVSLHGAPLALTQIQELRQSIKQFQKAGKFAYIIAPSYGSAGGIGEYYLASTFDRIWMHPVGIVSMPGISMETPYVKSVLDELGITPQFFQRKEFKSAFESFTSKSMSDANRVAMQSVVDSLGGQITAGIEQGRGFDADTVKELMADALIPAPQAIERKLVDALGYGVDVIDYIETTHGLAGIETVNLSRYSANAMAKKRGKEDVAYIHIAGSLTLAPDPYGESYGDYDLLMAGSDTAAAIDDAVWSGVSAIVLRVDSPGGTPAAAEVIRNAVVNAKKEGVTVYISMASMAASGGYWLSANADQIFALPGTLTGSIGVVGGKVTIQELAKKLDIKVEKVRYGENAGFWSIMEPFTPSQIERFEAMLDVTYDNFITLVSEGRNMTYDAAEHLAKGRVWTGQQALESNLVDGLGGIGTTLDILALELGYNDQSDLNLVLFPKPKPVYIEILEILEQQAVFMGVIAKLTPVLERIGVQLDIPATGLNVHSGLRGV